MLGDCMNYGSTGFDVAAVRKTGKSKFLEGWLFHTFLKNNCNYQYKYNYQYQIL